MMYEYLAPEVGIEPTFIGLTDRRMSHYAAPEYFYEQRPRQLWCSFAWQFRQSMTHARNSFSSLDRETIFPEPIGIVLSPLW